MATTTATTKTSLLLNSRTTLPDGERGPWNVTTISAAGISQSNGTAIGNTQPFVIIDNNTASNGVVLPVAAYIGQEITVYPNLVTATPKVYPPVGGTVNSGVINTPVSTAARKAVKYIAVDRAGLSWVTVGL